MLRQPIIRAELDNILNDFTPLTFDLETADSAHKIMKQIVEIQCMLSLSCDYGLPILNKSLLKVANSVDTQFLE